MNKARKGRSDPFLGAIMVFFFVILAINVREAISITDTKSSTSGEILIAESRKPDVHKRIISALLNVVIVVIFSTTSIPSLLEKKTSETVRRLRNRFGILSNLRLEGAVFVSIVTIPYVLVEMAAMYYKTEIEVGHTIVSKCILFPSLLVICPLFNFVALNLLGKSPTCSRILRAVVVMICFTVMLFGACYYLYIGSIRGAVIPNTEEVSILSRKVFEIIGKHRAFNNIYTINTDVSRPAFSIGMFWDQNIYINSMILTELSQKELFVTILHAAGYCYYRYFTMIILRYMLPVLLLIAAGGLFIFKSGLASKLVNSCPLPYGKIRKSPTRASTAMKLLVFCVTVVYAFMVISMIISNLLGRYIENRVDNFMVRIGYGEELLCFLEKTEEASIRSKSKMYSLLYESHPWMLERIRRIERNMESLKRADII